MCTPIIQSGERGTTTSHKSCSSIPISHTLCKNPHLRLCSLILERKGERERERKREKCNIDMRERHQLVASCTCPDQDSNPQPLGVRATLQPTEPPSQGFLHTFALTPPTLTFLTVASLGCYLQGFVLQYRQRKYSLYDMLAILIKISR